MKAEAMNTEISGFSFHFSSFVFQQSV